MYTHSYILYCCICSTCCVYLCSVVAWHTVILLYDHAPNHRLRTEFLKNDLKMSFICAYLCKYVLRLY